MRNSWLQYPGAFSFFATGISFISAIFLALGVSASLPVAPLHVAAFFMLGVVYIRVYQRIYRIGYAEEKYWSLSSWKRQALAFSGVMLVVGVWFYLLAVEGRWELYQSSNPDSLQFSETTATLWLVAFCGALCLLASLRRPRDKRPDSGVETRDMWAFASAYCCLGTALILVDLSTLSVAHQVVAFFSSLMVVAVASASDSKIKRIVESELSKSLYGYGKVALLLAPALLCVAMGFPGLSEPAFVTLYWVGIASAVLGSVCVVICLL